MARTREQYEAEIRRLESQTNATTALWISEQLKKLAEEMEEAGEFAMLALCGDAIKNCAAWDPKVRL